MYIPRGNSCKFHDVFIPSEELLPAAGAGKNDSTGNGEPTRGTTRYFLFVFFAGESNGKKGTLLVHESTRKNWSLPEKSTGAA